MVLAVFPFQLIWSCCFCHLRPVIYVNLGLFGLKIVFSSFYFSSRIHKGCLTTVFSCCQYLWKLSPAIMNILIKTVFMPSQHKGTWISRLLFDCLKDPSYFIHFLLKPSLYQVLLNFSTKSCSNSRKYIIS